MRHLTQSNTTLVPHLNQLSPQGAQQPPTFVLFLSFFISFFSSPNLTGRRLDVYHTSIHDVALVRI